MKCSKAHRLLPAVSLNFQELEDQGTSEVTAKEKTSDDIHNETGAGADGESSALISWQAKKPQLSRRAACGKRIFEELCKGRPVPDEVISELVVDAVRYVNFFSHISTLLPLRAFISIESYFFPEAC